MGPFLVL